MKTFVAFAAVLMIGAWSVATACGPDGKCVGKEKAACCMSKASAKKSCSIKHDAKQAKADAKTEQAPTSTANATVSAQPEQSTTSQSSETPKR